MATLFNTKISQTYEGLIKTFDNAVISATLKQLTDGSGNATGLYLNTAGDFKVTNILEWGSLKDTGTGVTITRYVTSSDGIENFDNNTSLPTSAAVKLYVDSKFATSDTLQEVLSFGNTTSGHDIVVSANDDITFTDSSKILMGASSDLQIYHDGSNSYIKDAGSGGLRIASDLFRVYKADLSGLMINAVPDDRVELYFNDNKKLATTNTGVDVTGNLVVSGTITGSGGSFLPLAGGTMTGNIVLNDNVKSIYGTASDGLEIFHDGFDSFITDSGTGKLWILGSTQVNIGSPSYEIGIQYIENASVNLRYDNAVKLETKSYGVEVTGQLVSTDNIQVGNNLILGDNKKAFFGGSNDLQIYHDGSHSYINEQGTGNLYLKATSLILSNSAGSNYLIGNSGGSVNMYFDGSEKFGTRTDGAKVTGNLEVTGTITGSGGSFLPLAGGTMTGTILCADNKGINIGASNDLQITHNGSTAGTIKNTSGNFNIQQSAGGNIFIEKDDGENMAAFRPDAAVELYYNGSQKLATTNSGISVTGNGVFSGNVTVPDNGQFIAGSNSDFAIIHDTNDSRIKNNTGNLYIDQRAVTESVFFRVSNNFALDTTALTISREGNLTTGASVTIAGDLTVNGTTTTINTQTLAVEDPLIELAKDNAANSVDIGMYGKYNDGTTRYLGLFSDASDSNKFKLFKGLTAQPTSTVNTSGTAYAAADLLIAGLEATTGSFDGLVTIESYIVHEGDTDSQFGFQGADEFRISIGGDLNFLADANGNYLYHNALQKMRTTSGGVYITGDTVSSSTVVVGSNASIFAENNLRFKSTGAAFIDHNTLAQSIKFRLSNSSSLDVTPLEITPLYLSSTVDMYFGNNDKIKLGAGNDLEIYSDGTIGVLKGNDVRLVNAAGGNIFRVNANAAELYYSDSKKFETTNTGVTVTGNIDGAASIFLQNYIYHSGDGNTYFGFPANDRFAVSAGGNTNLELVSNGVTLRHSGSNKLLTTATGVSVSGNIDLADGAARSIIGSTNQSLIIDAKPNQSTEGLLLQINGTDKLSILASGNATFAGNVGIGINPAEVLDLKTSTGDCRIRLDAPSGSDTEIKFFNDGAAQYTIGHDDDSDELRIALTNVEAPIMTFTKDKVASIGALSNGQTGRLVVNHDGGSSPVAKFMARTNKAIVQISDNDTTGYVSAENGLFSIGRAAGVNAANINIDAGNEVGFGTSTPTHKVDIYADANVPLRIHRPNNSNLNINGAWGIGFSTRGDAVVSTTDTRSGLFSYYNGNLFLATSNSDITSNPYGSARLIINNSGNVGIGVSPENRLHVKTNAADSTPQVLVQNGSTGDASMKFNVSGQSYVVGIDYDDSKKFKISSSSNLGTTDRITLLSTGQVGIGTITPGTVHGAAYGTTKLHIDGGTDRGQIIIEGDADASMVLSDNGGTTNERVFTTSVGNGKYTIKPLQDNGTSTAGGVAVTVTHNGNLLVGATALSDVGSLTKSHLIEGISESAGTGAVGTYNRSGTANCPSLVVLNRDTSTDSSNRFIQFYANVIGGTNTPMGGIVGNGASNVQFAALSDIREKENVKTISGSLDKINSLNPVEFDWKKSSEHINGGFIAQEVEKIFPEYIVENISNEGEEERKGLTGGMASGIVAHLVKSIQELTAKVEMLEKNCQCKN